MNIAKSKKVAITGSMGSGKSNVANIFREAGFDVFDVDECNRNLLEINEVKTELNRLFPEVFDNNQLNKIKLRKLIFNSQNAKEQLEAVLHPLILKEMQQAINRQPLFIAEVPTLFESKWEQYFDEIIVVSCDSNIIIERLMAKGLSIDDIESTWRNQLNDTQKIEKATTVFYNNKTLANLRDLVMMWIKENKNEYN